MLQRLQMALLTTSSWLRHLWTRARSTEISKLMLIYRRTEVIWYFNLHLRIWQMMICTCSAVCNDGDWKMGVKWNVLGLQTARQLVQTWPVTPGRSDDILIVEGEGWRYDKIDATNINKIGGVLINCMSWLGCQGEWNKLSMDRQRLPSAVMLWGTYLSPHSR